MSMASRQARRLSEKLEIHHTPRHGSWLNMAEIELTVSVGSASRGECLTSRRSKRRPRPGSSDAMMRASRSSGASEQRMHASS
jgi:hypothetical protein